MTTKPSNLNELCDYIYNNAEHIYVRELGATGAWGSFALTDLKPKDAIKHALRFLREGRIPIVVKEEST